MVTDNTHDRAQVILIGAIVIAFVLLGVVVVLNGLVYTEEVSSSSTTQSVNHAETTQAELRTTIQELIADEYDDEYEVSDEDQLENNITAFVNSSDKLHSNTSSSAVEMKDISVETDDDSPYDVGWVTGNELGPGSGNNVEIDGEIYRFLYDTEGKDGDVEYIFHTTGGEETTVEVRDAGSDVIIEGSDGVECREPKGSKIDFITGDVDGDGISCDISISDISSNIEDIEFIGPGLGHDIGQYELIADGLEPGDAVENHADGVGGVTYTDATFTYTSTDVTTKNTIRMTGIEEIE